MVCPSAAPEPANAEDAGASQAEGQPPETVLEIPSGGTEPANKKPRKRKNTSPKKPSKKDKSMEKKTEPTKRKKDNKANNAEPGDEPGEDKGAEQKEKERAIKEPCSL